MRIVIAGGHGQIALLLERDLSAAGHTAVGLIRKPEQVPEVTATGAEAVVLDLESADLDSVAQVLVGADAAVFAAGAGPNSGALRKDTVDRGTSVLLAEAAERAGVRRFLQISGMGVDAPPAQLSGGDWPAYFSAKAAAEDDLRGRDLDWVILRPGGLTNDPGLGRVTLMDKVADPGSVPRADVAAVIASLLTADVSHRTLELVSGDTPIDQAVREL
ncbi:NAD-dependent epimerase/dehydratase family protein [Streptomyces sp. uw30]|uniref:NAD(P)H-binding protein n=1 Tax=Streptomyces sp. uw30 TaxID=1828179 RepID=UPI0011CE4FAF|nr:NAD(P)H-binding protein [Streptomyces sp. uw30]TXS48914.1 NAD-dependent epimerase/dehydratase family protein [Streptomyces sp. uw30]